MINLIELDKLYNSKNLLAFSGGTDSTALFFLLENSGIKFDIAIVDYNKRLESKAEVSYAKELAKKFNIDIYCSSCNIKKSNFEHHAREFRYSFFNDIINSNGYDNLITGHQLNDRLEWLLMTLARGGGLYSIVGMHSYSKKDHYHIVRPLLETSSTEIKNYLESSNIKHFYDNSNSSFKHMRNQFRTKYSDSLVDDYRRGILKSFMLLQSDLAMLIKDTKIIKLKELTIIYKNESYIYHIDKELKSRDYILSIKQKKEIEQNSSLIISKIGIEFKNDKIFIFPYEKRVMDKKFKELCRVNKIPNKLRNYIYGKNINVLIPYCK